MLEKYKENIPFYGSITVVILFALERLYNVGMGYIEALLSKVIIQLLSHGFLSYIDVLHINIGKGTDQYISSSYTLLYMFFILALITFILYVAFSAFSRIRPIGKTKPMIKLGAKMVKVKERSKSNYLLITFLLISMFVAYFFIIMVAYDYTKNNYNNDAVVYIERSIDILAAYSGTKEINLLKARYRAIDGLVLSKHLKNILMKLRNLFKIR